MDYLLKVADALYFLENNYIIRIKEEIIEKNIAKVLCISRKICIFMV